MKPMLLAAGLLLAGCGPRYDVVIRGGTVYDGTGAPPRQADVAIMADSIVAVGDLGRARGHLEIAAAGLAVAPGFINMLSWAAEGLLVDGRAQSDVRQGVTLEVFGEGRSMGPLSDAMKREMREAQGDIRYPVTWTSLGEFLDTLVQRGIAVNVASFVGAATVRQYVLGHDAREPTEAELGLMQDLVRSAMRDGALGVGSSLIYEPGMFASTRELIALAQAAAEYDGMYISHIRNENDSLLDALDEFLAIARAANVRAEVYHLKAAGRTNWGRMDTVIQRMETARREGLRVSADMYTYPASATGLDALMPGWVREGGFQAWRGRLMMPETRRRLLAEWAAKPGGAFGASGGPQGVLLVGFRQDSLKPLTGKTLAQVAGLRGRSAEETAMDLVVQDESRVGAVYFTMSEDNLRRQVRLPWVSFGSDAGAPSAEGVFLRANPHPRAYGNFARLLGKYVREEKLISLEEAVHRLTGLPASHLALARRGLLRPGYHADVVVFDAATIQDHATFDRPHQYATGVHHVLVNGTPVLAEGRHTGATPGRVATRAPAWEAARR